MDENQINSQNHRIVLNALAGIGFIALVGGSLWLAAYSTRFVPTVVNGLGSAAVYLGSVFVPSSESRLSVVPTASTTIPFGNASSTAPSTSTSAPKPSAPTAGAGTSTVVPIGGSAATPAALSGLPDLIVTIDAIGYLATSSAESFVASSTVPFGSRPAVKFAVKNTGTNMTGQWRFSASIPTLTAYVYQSQLQQTLLPGDSIVYTLGFDQANRGVGQTISITVNSDHTVAESNSNNNSASAKITIIGG